jgi:pyridoxal 5'-phosphate synthase pdxT subunit
LTGMTTMIKIGILSLQGDIAEHISIMEEAMKKTGLIGSVFGVKTKDAVAALDALVIPGGESTTMCKLLDHYDIGEEIALLEKKGIPILGTCAGLVILSKSGCKEVSKTRQKLLGLIDIEVERNAFGRQKQSFEAELEIPVLGKEKYPAVFIRAPAIKKTGKGIKVLAEYNDKIVAAQKGNLIVLAFHPELTGDTRMHEYFLRLLK